MSKLSKQDKIDIYNNWKRSIVIYSFYMYVFISWNF